MGKKRLADISEKPSQKKKAEKDSKKAIVTGKQQGRLADMGQAALAEAEKIEKKEKEIAELAKKAAREEAKKENKSVKGQKAKKPGKRYIKAKKKLDRSKYYPLPQAINLVKETSISRFKGKVEFHLNVKEKGMTRSLKMPHPLGKEKKLTLKTEKRFPLVHIIIGKIDDKEARLTENAQAIIDSIGPKNINKAVLTSTMGPGIKIQLTNEKK